MADEKPQQDRLKALPPGVSAAWIDNDGEVHYEYTPYLPDERWQGVFVDSASFKRLPHTERLYRLSQAFLDAAIHLCEQAGESGEDLQWPEASVCYSSLHLATELFLKACVLRVRTNSITMNHDISDLRRQYHELFPGSEFGWPTPWDISARDIADALGFEVLQGIDRTPDQLFRYGADKSGAPSAGLQVFTPSEQMGYMTYLKARWTQVWNGIGTKADVQQVALPDRASRGG